MTGGTKKFDEHPTPASQSGPNTEKNDLEYCNGCGQSGDPANHGYYVDANDVGEDAEGATARLFREDAENFGEWKGFKEEDIGFWCYSCSWSVQRKRTQNNRSVKTEGGR
jgi:hypothetical protein